MNGGGGSPDAAYAEAKTSLWWDIENCMVPHGADPNLIAQNISTALSCAGFTGPISISSYGDTGRLSSTILHALSSTGIALHHVPAGIKDASDKKILVDMLFWAIDNPPPANILLISGDRDFCNALHKLRMRRYNILLAHAPSVSQTLVAAAKTVWHWKSFAVGEPPLSEPSYVSSFAKEVKPALETVQPVPPSLENLSLNDRKSGLGGTRSNNNNNDNNNNNYNYNNTNNNNKVKDDKVRDSTCSKESNTKPNNSTSQTHQKNKTQKSSDSVPYKNSKPILNKPKISNRPRSYWPTNHNIPSAQNFGPQPPNNHNIPSAQNFGPQPPNNHNIPSAQNFGPQPPNNHNIPSAQNFGPQPPNNHNIPSAQNFGPQPPNNHNIPSAQNFGPQPPNNHNIPSAQNFVPQPPNNHNIPSAQNFVPQPPNNHNIPSAQNFVPQPPNNHNIPSAQNFVPPPSNPNWPGSSPYPTPAPSGNFSREPTYYPPNPNHPYPPQNYHDCHYRPVQHVPPPVPSQPPPPPVLVSPALKTTGTSKTAGTGAGTVPNRPKQEVQNPISVILRALSILKKEKITSNEANISDCIRFGEINMPSFNAKSALEMAVQQNVVVNLELESKRKNGNNNKFYVPKNEKMWNFVNVMDIDVKISKKTLNELIRFLSSSKGRYELMASQGRYHVAIILKKSCLKTHTLGDVLQILNNLIRVKKWIIPNSSSGWQPLSFNLNGSESNLDSKPVSSHPLPVNNQASTSWGPNSTGWYESTGWDNSTGWDVSTGLGSKPVSSHP